LGQFGDELWRRRGGFGCGPRVLWEGEAEPALGMPSDLERLEAGLPGFAVQDDCSLALELGRRKLAVAFGSSDNLLPELCSQNRGI